MSGSNGIAAMAAECEIPTSAAAWAAARWRISCISSIILC